jgi:hypothetical protein
MRIVFWLLVLGIALVITGPLLSHWENQNGYPFGRMCDLTSSCPHPAYDKASMRKLIDRLPNN